MGSLKDIGCAVGEYVGDGKGEDGTDPLDDALKLTFQTLMTLMTGMSMVVLVCLFWCSMTLRP